MSHRPSRPTSLARVLALSRRNRADKRVTAARNARIAHNCLALGAMDVIAAEMKMKWFRAEEDYLVARNAFEYFPGKETDEIGWLRIHVIGHDEYWRFLNAMEHELEAWKAMMKLFGRKDRKWIKYETFQSNLSKIKADLK